MKTEFAMRNSDPKDDANLDLARKLITDSAEIDACKLGDAVDPRFITNFVNRETADMSLSKFLRIIANAPAHAAAAFFAALRPDLAISIDPEAGESGDARELAEAAIECGAASNEANAEVMRAAIDGEIDADESARIDRRVRQLETTASRLRRSNAAARQRHASHRI